MKDVRIAELAARQHNRFSCTQAQALGFSRKAIKHRLEEERWIAVHDAVYAIAPALDGDRARWTAAVLTDDAGVLSHASAAAAWGFWDRRRHVEIVTRPGCGGPRLQDGVLVHRSEALAGDTTVHLGLPITTIPRTLLDLAAHLRGQPLARAVREALRLELTTVYELVEGLATRHRGRRGSRRLLLAVQRYADLPVARCRSASEVRALEVLRDAGRPEPQANVRIADEEADLSWPAHRLIIEIDGPGFHLDTGEDLRKQRQWEAAGWTVHRLPAPDVFEQPHRLLALAPERP